MIVDDKLIDLTIELLLEASYTEHNRLPLSDELYGAMLMLKDAKKSNEEA